jgi:hypothetical protein
LIARNAAQARRRHMENSRLATVKPSEVVSNRRKKGKRRKGETSDS